MILDQLIRSLPEVESRPSAGRGAGRRVVTGVTHDGHRAGPGVVFVALPERLREDPRMLEAAVARRAAAIITPTGVPVPPRATSVVVRDSARALAVAAATLHGFPARHLQVVEVSGAPRSRRAVADLLFQLVDRVASPAGLVSAEFVRLAGRELPMPCGGMDPLDLQRGLEAHRMAGGSLVLLDQLGDPGCDLGPEILPRSRVIDTAAPGLPFRVLHAGRRGSILEWPEGTNGVRVAVPLTGGRHLTALAVALQAALDLGLDPVALRAAVPRLRAPAGILEPVRAGQAPDIRVDSPVCPSDLGEALGDMRSLTPGRLVLVLGARPDWTDADWEGWSRSARSADVLVATVADPRRHDPVPLAQRLACSHPGGLAEADRQRAVARAVGLARSGDTVVVGGKAAGGRQALGDVIVPWDDRSVVRQALADMGYPGEDWN